MVDYIQRVATSLPSRDRRAAIDEAMSLLRRFADADKAIIAVSAIGRQKGRTGRNGYDADSLSLAAFRESSELEYGADDAYILAPVESEAPASRRLVTMRHLKARFSQCEDISLRFDARYQSFTELEQGEDAVDAASISVEDFLREDSVA